jgi:hypothetical protein
MVLKRKRGDEFVPMHGQDPTIPEQEPAVKRTRTNPPRSARTAVAAQITMSVPSDTAPPKKTRAPRKKKVADPAEAVSVPMPQAGPSQQAVPIQQAGPSQQAGPGPSRPPAPVKRGRKKKVDDGGQSEPEKRKAQFKPRCPQNILDRVERVMTQR